MNTELALHAYVFFGNALNLLINRIDARQHAEIHTSAASLNDLYATLEPMLPKDILAGIDALPPDQRQLLLRVCVWCVERLRDDLPTLAGLTEPEAREVIAWLEHGARGK